MYQTVNLTRPLQIVKLFLTPTGGTEMPFAFIKKSMVYEGKTVVGQISTGLYTRFSETHMTTKRIYECDRR